MAYFCFILYYYYPRIPFHIMVNIVSFLNTFVLYIIFIISNNNLGDIFELMCILNSMFCVGIALGNIIYEAFMIDPAIIIETFLGTSMVFACFSLSGIIAPTEYFSHLEGSYLKHTVMHLNIP